MFTGLVEETGIILGVEPSPTGIQFQVRAPLVSQGAQIGDSIAVNGCCLTMIARENDVLTFDLLNETLARTNLGALAPGSVANLERALAAHARLGGHFVQGHIDTTSRVLDFTPVKNDFRLEVALPGEFARYVAFKGSIAIDGISLTVAEVGAHSFTVWIIPHTRSVTNLHAKQAGDAVNLEFDLLAKYVERMLESRLSK